MILNRMKRTALRVAAAIAMTGSAIAAGGAPKEAGIWYDDTGKGAVKVDLCGDKLCGHIYWLKEPLNAEGKPLRDKHNPNEGQQNRPICGLQVIGGLAHMEDGEWDTGWIYDPKEGKSYSVALTMADPNTLKVTGYLVMKMMGRTLTWTRAPADLPSCATNAAAAPAAAGGAAAATVKAAPAPSKVAAPLPSEQDEVSPPPAATKSKAAAQPAEGVQVKPVPKAASVPAQTPPATVKAAAPKPKPNATKASTTATAPSAAKAAPAKTATKSDGKAAPDSKPAAKTAAKSPPAQAGATASGAKTATKAAATKPAGAKGKEEALPWTPNKKAPAEGTTPTAEATDVTPVKAPRPATPDQQARPFGTE